MGHELTCRLRVGRSSIVGTALLESEELRFRGPKRLVIRFADIRALNVSGGDLVVAHARGVARFSLGAQAKVWAERIRHPKSVLDKLGVRPGARVAVLGVDDARFARDLAARTGDVSRGRPRKDTDLVFLEAADRARLTRLAALRGAIRPEGGIWVIWRKGRPELREDDVRDAARRAGLVDVKVVAFSPSHSALKLVIPVARRR